MMKQNKSSHQYSRNINSGRRALLNVSVAAGGALALSSVKNSTLLSIISSPLNNLSPGSLNGAIEYSGIYKNSISYDHKPEFIKWTVGNQNYGSIMEQKSTLFSFEYSKVPYKNMPFRSAVIDGLRKVDHDRKEKKIALAVSGGMDSEALAIGMLQLGLPFEMYFLNVWNLNFHNLDTWVKPFAKKFNIKLNVVNLDEVFFKQQYVPKAFSEIGTELPSYLAMTYLFSQIPDSDFILCGEGDLAKTSRHYSLLYKEFLAKQAGQHLHSGPWLPFSTAEIVYRVWAQQNKRYGQYYFYSSTPELIASALNHPLFQYKIPYSSTRPLMLYEFPELSERSKLPNWGYEDEKAQENAIIRKIVYEQVKNNPDYHFWTKNIGSFSNLKDFKVT